MSPPYKGRHLSFGIFPPNRLDYAAMKRRVTKSKSALSATAASPRKGDLRKREIIESTIECIALDGVAKTTFESIGRRIDIGKSHVVYHFPRLDDLLMSSVVYVYRTGAEIVEEFMNAESNPALELRAYLKGTFHWMKTHPSHAAVGLFLLYESLLDPRYRQVQIQVKSAGHERITRILSRRREFGHLKPKRLRELAEHVQCQLMGSLAYAFGTGEASQLPEMEAQTLVRIGAILKSAAGKRG